MVDLNSKPRVRNRSKIFVVILISVISLSSALLAASNMYSSYNVRVLAHDTAAQSSSEVRTYTLPTPRGGPNAIIAGPNGTMWFVEFSAAKIGEFFTSNNSFIEFAIPNDTAIPASLTIDSKSGTVWFSDQKGSGSIWRLDPKNGTFKQYVIPTKNSFPLFVFVDSQHNVWFTESIGDKIGELVYPSYSLQEYPLPISQVEPLEFTLDKNGSTFWMTVAKTTSQTQPGFLDTFNIQTKTFGSANTPTFSLQDPVGIVQDKSGNLWISEHRGSAIVEFTPSNSTWKKFQTSPPPPSFGFGYVAAPATISIDSKGNLWFLEHFANRVGEYNPTSGVMQEFTIPGTGAYSVLNTIDSQGNFWFTDFAANAIGMISGNANTSTVARLVGTSGTPTVNAGQSVSANVEFKNIAPSEESLTLNATSSFSPDGKTTPNEVSFNVSTIQLASNQSATVHVTIVPDASLSSGLYSISIIANSGNYSTIQTFFITVNASPFYFFYHIGDYTQYILIVAIVIIAAVFLFVRRKSSSTELKQVEIQPRR